jgi:hypothetical protein
MFQSSLSVIVYLSGQSLSFRSPGANAHSTDAGQPVAYAHHFVRIVNPVCQNITGTLSQRSSILLGRPPMLFVILPGLSPRRGKGAPPTRSQALVMRQ